jgi:hypothetical protein
MEGAIGTLNILIEADAAGLTSQLKKAGTSINTFINQMNSQSVDWQSILTGAISPAIIAGIASTFAESLTGILSFSNELGQVAAANGVTFSQAYEDMADSILKLQANSGASTSTLTQSFTAANKPLQNTADALQVTGDVAAYANEALGGSSDATIALSGSMGQLFNIFGVTGSKNIDDGMATITQAAAASRMSLSDFINMLISIGPQFNSVGVPLDSLALQFATISSQAGNTASATEEVFQKMATAITSPTDMLNLLATTNGSVTNDIQSSSQGVMTAYDDVSNHVNSLGRIVASTQLGFSSATLGTIDTAHIKLSALDADELLLQKDIIPWQTYLDGLSTPMSTLRTDWGKVKTAIIDAGLNNGFLTFLDTALQKIKDILDLLNPPSGSGGKSFDWKELFGAVGTGAVVGGEAGTVVEPGGGTIGGGVLGAISLGIADFFKQLSGNIPAVAASSSGNTTNVTNNNTSVSIAAGAVKSGSGVASSAQGATALYNGMYGK